MDEQEQREQQHEDAHGSDDWIAGATITAAAQPMSVGSVEVSFAGLDLPRLEGHEGDSPTAYA